MGKKVLTEVEEEPGGTRKVQLTHDTLKEREEQLKALAARFANAALAMKQNSIASIDIDGGTKFDRGLALVNAFFDNCSREIGRNLFLRPKK